jgi:hypothetical protein
MIGRMGTAVLTLVWLSAEAYVGTLNHRRALCRPCGVACSAARGPTTAQLRQLLAQRGVSTAGIFEREELMALAMETGGLGGAPASSSDGIEALSLQDVMSELEDRNVPFDILSPKPVLYDLLRKERSGEASWRPTTSSPREADQKRQMPTSPRADSNPRNFRDEGLASAAAANIPRRSTRASRAPPSSQRRPEKHEADEPWAELTDAVQEDLVPIISDVASGIYEQVSPWVRPATAAAAKAVRPATAVAAKAAAKTAAKARGSRARIASLARKWLPNVQLPPRPVLLAFCVGALRFGVVRAALAAVALQLTVELGQEALGALRPGERKDGSRGERK